jgi:hypothetical protein
LNANVALFFRGEKPQLSPRPAAVFIIKALATSGFRDPARVLRAFHKSARGGFRASISAYFFRSFRMAGIVSRRAGIRQNKRVAETAGNGMTLLILTAGLPSRLRFSLDRHNFATVARVSPASSGRSIPRVLQGRKLNPGFHACRRIEQTLALFGLLRGASN